MRIFSKIQYLGLSVLCLFFCKVSLAQSPTVIISEILYDTPLNEATGTANAHDGEFISLYNYDNFYIDISGWKITATSVNTVSGITYTYTFPNNARINSQSLAIVAFQSAGSSFNIETFYNSFNTTGTGNIFYQNSMLLPNNKTHIKIYNANNTLIDEMIYDGENSAPAGEILLRARNGQNPSRAGSLSVSLQRKNITINNGQQVFKRNDYSSGTRNYVRLFSFNSTQNLSINDDIWLQYIFSYQNQNYILTRTFLNHNESTSNNQYKDKIQYFDGLGRPVQTVERGVSPNKKDIATYIEHNKAGKELQQWLPRPTDKDNGNYIPLSEFKALPNDIYNNDASPFTKTIHDASGLNRIVEQYGAGEDWYANNKSVKKEYLTNASSDCRLYKVENTFLKRQGDYPASSLYVTKTTDEDGKVSYEFKDKLGNVVMTRQQDGSNNYDTYYVYDDFNRLCFVIPPKATDLLMRHIASYDPSENTVIKTLCYTYGYDDRGNCTYKRLPGAEPTIYIYDKANNPILSKNGEQQKKGVWMFSIPDRFGRICLTGTCTNIFEYTVPLKDRVVYASFRDPDGPQSIYPDRDTYNGYDIRGLTLNNPNILTVNYYDNYDFRKLNGYIRNLDAYNFMPEEANGIDNYEANAKTLLTGTLAAVLDSYNSPSSYIKTVMYYDDKKRCIQKISNNIIDGHDKEYYSYNFTGQPVKYKQIHTVAVGEDQSDNSITEEYAYTYDHAGRLMKTTHKLNDNSEVIVNENTYDEIGRLTRASNCANYSYYGDYMAQTYSYNIRGWLTKVFNAEVSEEIKYNDNQSGTPSWNGNISSIAYITSKYGYTENTLNFNYEYDGLNRLVSATNTAGDGLYSSNYVYDKNGNIKSLTRNDGNTDADMTYYYLGNQLADGINNSLTQAQQLIDEVDELSLDERLESLQDLSLATQQIIGNKTPPRRPRDPKPETYENPAYIYDNNGNLKYDYNKGITYAYNVFDMPLSITAEEQNGTIQYTYDAIGNKLEASYSWNNGGSVDGGYEGDNGDEDSDGSESDDTPTNSTKKTQYVGNKIYRDGVLDMIMFDNGYIKDGEYYYYLKDHLGNNMAVINTNVDLIQKTYYHPYGKPIADLSYYQTAQPYKYGGKEEETMFGLDLLDFHARQFSFDNEMPPMFTQPDMLSDVRPWESPYSFCGNNPLKNVDPTGMFWSNRNFLDTRQERNWEASIESALRASSPAESEPSEQSQEPASQQTLPAVTVTGYTPSTESSSLSWEDLKPDYNLDGRSAAWEWTIDIALYTADILLGGPTGESLAAKAALMGGSKVAKAGMIVGRTTKILTQWGWTGGKAWKDAVKAVTKGGTHTHINGKIPTRIEAEMLIKEAKGISTRIDIPHASPNPHNYNHINYTTPSGIKGTIKIQ